MLIKCCQGRKLRGVWGEPPPTSKFLPFRRAKMVVKCTAAGQSTGQRTTDELLLLEDKKITSRLITQSCEDKKSSLSHLDFSIKQ